MSDKNGFIYIHRKLLENPLLNKKPFCKGFAWITLCILANKEAGYTPVKNGGKIKILRGECGYSKKALADIFGWSRGKVDRWLSELENARMIQQKKAENHTVIRIVKYNTYQMKQQNSSKIEKDDTQKSADIMQCSDHFSKKMIQQPDIEIEQQKNIKTIQQKKAENNDYITISKSELEKMIQQKIEETNTKTYTNNNIYNTKEYIYNTHTIEKNVCVENNNLSSEDLKILRKYAKENGARRIKPYVAELIKNGGYLDILKEEKERLEKLQQKKAKEVIPPPENEINETEEERQKAFEEFKANVRKIKERKNDDTDCNKNAKRQIS